MSSHALIPFTGKPDSSFGGVSRTNYIGPCDPISFDAFEPNEWTDAECWFRFPVSEYPAGTQAFFDVKVSEKDGVLSLSEADMCRLYCHAVLQQLPDRAFEEAVEVLNGMHEFYKNTPPLLPQPSPTKSLRAKITGHYTAPVYPIPEE